MEAFLESDRNLVKVGQGSSGTVWAENTDIDTAGERPLVLKRKGRYCSRSLLHEQNMHMRILHALQLRGNDDEMMNDVCKQMQTDSVQEGGDIPSWLLGGVRVNIPDRVAYLEASSTLWADKLLPRLPEGLEACEALVNERILPLPRPVGEILAHTFARSAISARNALANNPNESCFVRPYLGRRRRPYNLQDCRMTRLTSLHNYPLMLDQMWDMGLPVSDYALAMARGLAYLHWVVAIDANDVEYVLAPPRQAHEVGPSLVGGREVEEGEGRLGAHTLWILDFDCCRELEMPGAGMMRAAKCSRRNSPFYPRPTEDDRDRWLWCSFQKELLRVSRGFLEGKGDEMKRLPELLMENIRENPNWARSLLVDY